MRHNLNTACRDMGRDERGTIAIIFSLTALIVLMIVGLAIDGGRAYQAHAKTGAAIDAAALAAAKGMREANLDNDAVTALAQTFFDENMKGYGEGFIDITSFNVSINRDTGAVAIDVTSDVKTTFGQLAGVPSIMVPNSTIAMFDSKDIELGLSLDVTGSMCDPCTKIADLKEATKALLDILMPDGGPPNRVRVGFAPFAVGINAGPYANAASNGRSPDGCVYEREGLNTTGDEAPSIGAYMQVAGDPGITSRLNRCPGSARITPLTDDKNLLKTEVDSFTTGRSTSGHLGTAWAWYLVSPNWASIWGGASQPVAYDDDDTIKAVILMTDGIFNTYGGIYDPVTNRIKSENDTAALCTNMKSENVVVYTVGFQLSDPRAIDVLKNCATTVLHFFDARDGDQLRNAFRAIAVQLNSLRLTH